MGYRKIKARKINRLRFLRKLFSKKKLKRIGDKKKLFRYLKKKNLKRIGNKIYPTRTRFRVFKKKRLSNTKYHINRFSSLFEKRREFDVISFKNQMLREVERPRYRPNGSKYRR